ncbi:MAG: nucleotide exchange factor GrpE [Bacteroidales bacterium]
MAKKKRTKKNTVKSTNKMEVDVNNNLKKESIEIAEEENKDNKIDELEEKLAETNDKFLRLYSEFDNFRKRTLKEQIELTKTASEEIIIELLPVVDDFERAMKAAEETENQSAVNEGMILIYNKLKGILEKKGLKAIKSVGEDFNTDFHEAITYIDSFDKKMKGKVVDEIERGYMLNDKVIRYTKVIIGK